MIIEKNKCFVLTTKNTLYAFRVLDTGHLEHLYYGKKIRFGKNLEGIDVLKEQHAFPPGNAINYDNEHMNFTLEDICLEMSGYGKGDVRESFVEIINQDGSMTSDFLYTDFEIIDGKSEMDTLPSSYGDNNLMELKIILSDVENSQTLELYYAVFEDCDVITRRAVLINDGDDSIKLRKLMSLQLDLPVNGYKISSFHGSWANEMNKSDLELKSGKYVGSSITGSSSNRNNPFFMISEGDTSQNNGKCYGFNLVYSGNHYEAVEVSSYGKTRVVQGINPTEFTFVLESNERFETPEAVLSFSNNGFNGLSQNMHRFVREHIVRGEWKNKRRPVLINSWEANYFNISESKLLKLAGEAKKAGIELFVMDDGWFGNRTDDKKSLGDWYVDEKKLPNGVDGICDKINKLGMDFGIWIEPEMVNVDSELYRKHPDYCLDIPGHKHSEGRNQRVLDLCRKDVQEYIIGSIIKILSSANIAYVKWDMNRIITDYYSKSLPKERQGETGHRYIIGLYKIMKEVTKRFPKVLFEGCAAGGNRFDLGILCYFPQIWGSDNTDSICRAGIQNSYSYGYPLETVGSHVSGCPNHQTLRITPLETRFAVASFGSLGYECNLCDMNEEQKEAIKHQVALYKKLRPVMQFGEFYRGRTFDDNNGNICEWTVVSKNKKRAVGMIVQKQVIPNTQFEYYKPTGLREDYYYHFTNRNLKYNIKEFGDLVNAVSPVHVKQDSLVHNTLAKFIKMDGETEDYYAYGDVLMEAGVKLKQGFSGTGYNDQVRYFQDYASRMYLMKSE